VAQEEKHLPSKCEALSSNSSIKKKRKKEIVSTKKVFNAVSSVDHQLFSVLKTWETPALRSILPLLASWPGITTRRATAELRRPFQIQEVECEQPLGEPSILRSTNLGANQPLSLQKDNSSRSNPGILY
jgi:hypothetical protein